MKNGGPKQNCCVYNFGQCILILTDLIIESAIRENEEKRSSLEMNSCFTW